MTKPTPLQIHNTVVFAVFLRELQTRFGKYRLGYFWAFFDPMSHVLVISSLFIAGFRNPSIAGVSPPLIVVTGIIPFYFFRYVITNCLKAIDSNKGLFNYRRVKPADVFTARILLESIIHLLVFAVLIAGFAYFGFPVEIVNPLGAILTFALLVVFSTGLGFVMGILGPLYPELGKLIPVAIRPLYFISGVFFAADSIPDPYRKYVLINPLIHVSDLIRSSLFSSFTSESASITYLTCCALVSLFLGLAFYRINRIAVVTSRNQ